MVLVYVLVLVWVLPSGVGGDGIGDKFWSGLWLDALIIGLSKSISISNGNNIGISIRNGNSIGISISNDNGIGISISITMRNFFD